jgi:hypothetical protein
LPKKEIDGTTVEILVTIPAERRPTRRVEEKGIKRAVSEANRRIMFLSINHPITVKIVPDLES